MLEDPGARAAVSKPGGVQPQKLTDGAFQRQNSTVSSGNAFCRSTSSSPGLAQCHTPAQPSPPAETVVPSLSPDASLSAEATRKPLLTLENQAEMTDQSKDFLGLSEQLDSCVLSGRKSYSGERRGELLAAVKACEAVQKAPASDSLVPSASPGCTGPVEGGVPQSEKTGREEDIPAAVNPGSESKPCGGTADSGTGTGDDSGHGPRQTGVSCGSWRSASKDRSSSAEARFAMLKESIHRRIRSQNFEGGDVTTSPGRLLSSVSSTPRMSMVKSGWGQAEVGDVIPLRDFLWGPEKASAQKSRRTLAAEENGCFGPASESTLRGCRIEDFELADPRFGGEASLLGRGTYGVVRKLRHKRTGKVYAVKSIEKENVVRAGMVSQVEFELVVQKDLLRHRNVLRCFACVEDTEQVHLILEYCSRGDLYTKIRSQPLRRLSEQEAFVYFSQLVNGLHYLHSRGVMHRDLKLENLLLDGKNVLKIADLGWCGSVLGKGKNFNFCGTLDYLAPEMIKGVGHDWRVDLWGAGKRSASLASL